MGLFTSRTEITVTPEQNRLIAAAHEVGHVALFRAGGYTVRKAWITTAGDRVGGETDVVDDLTPEPGYVAGLLAGHAATALWFELEYGLARWQAIDTASVRAEHDYTLVTKLARRHRIDQQAAYRRAETMLRRDWKRTMHATRKLADCGSLDAKKLIR
ncbi:hypothetical protein [Actinopolyspora halophila]|uniref:hypothetical protein n=1 Tax=Actinopolyspora halophila TaxID=1850 RepID=UPI000371631A|nr:hypothetical protein [Actinopolyspora halophila]